MHGEIIDALGGVTQLSKSLSEVTGTDVSVGMVSNWKRDGVSWRYRPAVAALASAFNDRGGDVEVPEDFLLK